MAQELKTTLRWDGRIVEGTAALEGGALVFSGGASLNLPFGEIFSVEANSGWLELRCSRGFLLLELGPKATAWAERIKNPKGMAEKLGLDATKKVAIVGKLDADVRADVEASGAKVAKSARGKGYDAVFLAVAAKKDLEKVPAAREMMKDEGALWVVYPSTSDALREREVIIAGRTLQLTDGKPLKMSDAISAIRFVVPPGMRKKK